MMDADGLATATMLILYVPGIMLCTIGIALQPLPYRGLNKVVEILHTIFEKKKV